MPQGANSTTSLQAYPNIRAAAKILGVSPSTLSRRPDLRVEARGERDRVLSAAEILRLGAIFRKRSLNDVAYDLLEHARAADPADAQRVENEIEAFFEVGVPSTDQREQFITLARRLLPPDLYAQIEAVLAEHSDELPEGIQGYPPIKED